MVFLHGCVFVSGSEAPKTPSLDLLFGKVTIEGSPRVSVQNGLIIPLKSDEISSSFYCFDPDLLRPAIVWTGEAASMVSTTDGRKRPSLITAQGSVLFTTTDLPGVVPGGRHVDPRSSAVGAVPLKFGAFVKHSTFGDHALLHYKVNTLEVEELPGIELVSDLKVFTRLLNIRGKGEYDLSIAELDKKNGRPEPTMVLGGVPYGTMVIGKPPRLAVGMSGDKVLLGSMVAGAAENQYWARLSIPGGISRIKFWYAAVNSNSDVEAFRARLAFDESELDIKKLAKTVRQKVKSVQSESRSNP